MKYQTRKKLIAVLSLGVGLGVFAAMCGVMLWVFALLVDELGPPLRQGECCSCPQVCEVAR